MSVHVLFFPLQKIKQRVNGAVNIIHTYIINAKVPPPAILSRPNRCSDFNEICQAWLLRKVIGYTLL